MTVGDGGDPGAAALHGHGLRDPAVPQGDPGAAEEGAPRQAPRAHGLEPGVAETYRPAPDYSASEHHFQNFFDSIRTGAPMVEDAAFGLRAAGPAVVSNLSYFENRPYAWDPVAMKASPLGT